MRAVDYFSGLACSTAGSSHKRRALAAGIHEATLAGGMAVGTIVGGVLGTLVSQRVPYVWAGAVLLVMVVPQSIAWWIWSSGPIFQRLLEAWKKRVGIDFVAQAGNYAERLPAWEKALANGSK